VIPTRPVLVVVVMEVLSKLRMIPQVDIELCYELVVGAACCCCCWCWCWCSVETLWVVDEVGVVMVVLGSFVVARNEKATLSIALTLLLLMCCWC
jgi:hypothetical protein